MRNHQCPTDRRQRPLLKRPGPVAVVLLALFLAWAVPAVQAAERMPNDPHFSEQWYLHKIGVSQAWVTTLGYEGIPVAVIDSGVDLDHPDLKDNIWSNRNELPGNGVDDDLNGYVDDTGGWDFVGDDNDPRPDINGEYSALGANHGTITAGIIAARGDNGQGIAGVTWQGSIMPLRVLNSQGQGDPNDVVRAVEYAVKNGARVITLGFVGPSDSQLLRIALHRAYEAGVVVVAAAGNAPDGGEAVNLDLTPLYPVCLDSGAESNFVIGVAAVDEFDKRATFSNYGAGCADLSAPGVHMISTSLFRPAIKAFRSAWSGYYNGTSVAAPLVAGTAALLLSMDPKLKPAEVLDLLASTAAPTSSDDAESLGKIGRGRVDVAAAVRKLSDRLATKAAATTAHLLPSPQGGLLAAAPGAGRPAEVRLFTPDGLFVRSFEAFPKPFQGGVSLATGHFTLEAQSAIAVAAGAGGQPQIRIFDRDTKEVGNFLAFDAAFRGGVRLAAGDLDGNGRDEIVAAAGPGGGPHVRVFTANGGRVGGGFFAFEKNFRGGVTAAVGDFGGDGRTQIAVVSGPGRVTTVRIFGLRGEARSEFRPFGDRDRRGARIEVQDINRDGQDEILVTPESGVRRQTAVFGVDGRRFGAFDAASLAADKPTFRPLGTFGAAVNDRPEVTVVSAGWQPLRFSAFERRYFGGVTVRRLD